MKKGTKNASFALKVLHFFLKNNNVEYDQFEEVLATIIDLFNKTRKLEIIDQILLIITDLIHISEEYAKIIFEQIDLIDACFKSFSFNSLSLISELLSMNQDIINEFGINEQIPQFLEIFSHQIKSINDPQSLIFILQIFVKFMNLDSDITFDCFNSFGLWDDINQLLDISNSEIKLNTILLLKTFIENGFFDFYQFFDEKVIQIFISGLNNCQSTNLLTVLFDLYIAILNTSEEYQNIIISNSIHNIIVDRISFLPFLLQGKSIELLFILYNNNSNLLKQIDISDMNFINVLINIINESVSSDDLSQFFQKSCVILDALIGIETSKNKTNTELINYCLDNLEVDELILKNDEISAQLLSNLNL